jgi:hypothetical protein
MKPVLKAPGTKRLKLKYDCLLSNVAFGFNLRRYTWGGDLGGGGEGGRGGGDGVPEGGAADEGHLMRTYEHQKKSKIKGDKREVLVLRNKQPTWDKALRAKVRQCRSTLSNPR